MTTHSTHPQAKKAPVPVFLAAIIVIFFCSLSAADSIGFVPDYIDGLPAGEAGSTPSDNAQGTPLATDSSNAIVAVGGARDQIPLSNLPELGVETPAPTPASPVVATKTSIKPVRIIIPSGSIDLPVQNPTTTNVDTLDTLLKHGPAHYINSSDLGEAGNLIIFAHSSHLPVVINKMYQAFNNIPYLKTGDTITIVGSDGNHYLYSVASVIKASVNDGLTIDTSNLHGTNLTLVTCDTLTGKSARFVLSATFVGISSRSN